MPKVSIIIPVYNAEKALRKCIDSILNQEYKDFELLLMDDGSKDSSPSIQYSTIPPTVEYSLTEKGKTLIPALDTLYQWAYAQMKA